MTWMDNPNVDYVNAEYTFTFFGMSEKKNNLKNPFHIFLLSRLNRFFEIYIAK